MKPTACITDWMAVLVTPPERRHCSSAILASHQHITLWLSTIPCRCFSLWRRNSIRISCPVQRMRRDVSSCSRLVNAVVIGRTTVASFCTTCAIAVSTTRARTSTTFASSNSGIRLRTNGLVLRVIRLGTCLRSVSFSRPCNIAGFQVETTCITNHSSSRRPPP
jgi:hypothetical protein